MGMDRSGAHTHAGRRVQHAVQPHPPARIRRLLPHIPRHQHRHRPVRPSAQCRREDPAIQGRHARRTRRGRRQDIHRRRRMPRGETSEPCHQTDDRRAEPSDRTMGEGLPDTLPGREHPVHDGGRRRRQGRGTLLGEGRGRRLGCGHRKAGHVPTNARQSRTPREVLLTAQGRNARQHRYRGSGRQRLLREEAEGRDRQDGEEPQPDRQTGREGPHARRRETPGATRRRQQGVDRLRGPRRGHAVHRRGAPVQKPRHRHHDQRARRGRRRRAEMRGPVRQVRVPARDGTWKQHRVRDRHAGVQLHGRTVQHATLSRARPTQSPGRGSVHQLGQHVRQHRRKRRGQAGRQRIPDQATVREIPQPARTDEHVPRLRGPADRRQA